MDRSFEQHSDGGHHGSFGPSAAPTREEIAADISWLHATIRWLILNEGGPADTLEDYISRPTLARKAQDKLDNLAKALGL